MKIYAGRVAEWLKAADCKSVDVVYVGSNPTPSTIKNYEQEINEGKRVIWL